MTDMRVALLLLIAAAVAGCAASTGIVPMGSNTYFISKQAAPGSPRMGSLKAEAIDQAGAHCSRVGKQVSLLSTNESQPPSHPGNNPRVEITLMCV